MSEDNNCFCPACGRTLPGGAAFCPECGAILDDGSPAPAASTASAYASGGKPVMPSGVKAAYILSILYVISTFLIALSLLSVLGMADEVDEAFIEMFDKDFDTYMEDNGIDMTLDDLGSACMLGGIVGIVSAIFALVGVVFCAKAQNRMLTVAMFGASSAVYIALLFNPMFGPTVILNIIFGIVVTAVIYTSKGYFTS